MEEGIKKSPGEATGGNALKEANGKGHGEDTRGSTGRDYLEKPSGKLTEGSTEEGTEEGNFKTQC